MDKEQIDKMEAAVEKALRDVMVHVDSAQLFVTVHNEAGDDTETLCFSKGKGNWYARYGQVGAWVIKQDASNAVGDDDIDPDEEAD